MKYDELVEHLSDNISILSGEYTFEAQDSYRNRYNKRHRTTFRRIKDYDKAGDRGEVHVVGYSEFRELVEPTNAVIYEKPRSEKLDECENSG